jgi:malonyl-CoA O-methyltransferase
MHDIGDQLVHAGFADPVMDQEHLSLSWATPEALLAELRTLGANTDPARHAGLRTPRWRARLADALRGLAGADGRLHLSFEIVYGHAFNPPPRAKLAPQTEVSLDAMRAMVRGARTPR